ncbi:MAG: hypothetical protein ACFFBP_01255 [Promethearchaeota archaeon]
MIVPKIGSILKFDGINWIVVGAGDNFFKYKAEKGIFSLVNLDLMDCLVVLIKGNDVIITVDPTIPSVKVDDEELLIEYGDTGTYLLLKYERENN